MSDWTYYPLSTAPAPYDTVWCRFPFVEAPDQPSPKARPALVKQAFADQDGQPWVTVVYGTSVKPFKRGHENFTVAKLVDMDMCGLKCATRFCMDREVTIPYSEEFFEAAPGQPTPVLGHLSQYQQRVLQIQMGYLQNK